MSRYSILLLFLIFTFSYQALYSQKYATVKGRIIDKNSREELVGAIVLTQDINKGTYSNSSGVYQLTTRPKEIQLVFKFIGYQDVVLNFYLKRDTTINISMLQDNTLQAASVYASKLENTVKASGMGVIDISLRQVKSVPALMGEVDLMKYIQLMPGVQSGGDGNVGLYVRGGNYDQNMITLDGAIIYKPEHLLGFVSSFNPDVIDKTTLYKSSFPARYGSRLSSVVDIRTKEGDFQRYHASASIGFLSAKISAEGPIIKNKTSFLVSGRASYYNLITKSL